MGVNRYDNEEGSVSRGTLDGPPARSKGKTVPVDDLSTTVSLLGSEGYGSGEDQGMGSDPSIRALTAAAKMLEGAQELNSILPLPQELMGMLDMIRVGIPQQLEQLEASRAMLGQSGAPNPMGQMQLMGAPQSPMMGGGAPSPMAPPAPAGPGAGQPGMPPGMPMI